MEHLRYPEDLFKVQRYQFARYHVTDPSDWYSGTNRWAVPEDPYAASKLQPPYRLFVNKADDSGQTWGMSTVFVPNGKSNLAAYMAVGSDATDEDELRQDEGAPAASRPDADPGPGPGRQRDGDRAANVRDALLPFNQGESKPIFGNVLTMPVADGLLYLQPVYATRATSTAGFPELQYVIVSYGGSVGIGTTLTGALADALNVSPDDQQTEPSGHAATATTAGAAPGSINDADPLAARPGAGGLRRRRPRAGRRRHGRVGQEDGGGPRPRRPGHRARRQRVLRRQRHLRTDPDLSRIRPDPVGSWSPTRGGAVR